MKYREFFFKYRSYTPIPLIVLALILANTTIVSFIAGLLVTVLGESMRLWSVRYSGSATRTTGEVGADVLVVDGPYGHTRNPLYIGNFFMGFGMFIMAWPWMPWMLIIYLVFFIVQYGAIVSLEESFLKNKFPSQYAEYASAVPRWFPQWKRWGQAVRQPTPLKKALRTERNTLQSFSCITIAILLRWVLG